MKFKLLLPLCLLIAVNAKSQTACTPVPDAVGKYLAAVFLNREDLSKTPVFPGAKEMSLIDHSEEAPVAATVGAPEVADKPLIREWERLMYLAQQKNIVAANTEYAGSYFSSKEGVDGGTKYVLYIALKHKANTIAVKVGVQWYQNKWVLTNVSDLLYLYRNKEKNEIRFDKQDADPEFPEQVPAVTYAPSMAKLSPETADNCLANPDAFIKQVLKDLATPEKEFSNLLSTADFDTYYKPELVRLYAKLSKDKSLSQEDQEKLKTLQSDLIKHPEQEYQEYVGNVKHLSEYLSTVKYSAKSVGTVTYHVSNYSNQVLGSGKILLIVDAKIKTTAGNEGIPFSAYWLNGKWQLSDIQSNTYLISEVE